MPIHPVSRAYVTRVAVVATTSAAAVLLTVLPAGGTTATDAAPAATSAAVAPAAVSVPMHVVDPPAAAADSAAVANALSKVGAPYVWGATGPSAFDCSGLINWAFAKAGVELPRTSRALSQVGMPVSQADLQPGDLLFFYSPVSHAGIYIGDGLMVHASNSSKPVAVDPIAGREFSSARRVA